ncbi:MAG TPA: hypothetical protein VGR96_06110 [Acidobacteriaceae bacterium]|nr:hypothetical protein [Acidobacteriaceae bacterium]
MARGNHDPAKFMVFGAASPLVIDLSFAHVWEAEVLPSRPLILPARQFVYPAEVEEVERGALEVLVRPAAGGGTVPADAGHPPEGIDTLPFLATCALGFSSPLAISGIWACPDPEWMCVVAGGYAYLIDTVRPRWWEQVEYRPVTAIHPLPHLDLLLFAGFHTLLAWGRDGIAWRTGRLSWDGVRIASIQEKTLVGFGWDMTTDRELEFEVELKTGEHRGGGYLQP